MKNKILVTVAAALLAAGSIIGFTAYAQPATERHPAIRRAITALEEAKVYLKNAKHDFGGHRAEALTEVDKAIEQLKLALKYDRT